jgi:ribonucleoside-diphosphate reductase alpha chain
MMAAAQSFISGAISKTINMPNDATIRTARTPTCCPGASGVKANALYRDGSKLSQPLASALIDGDEEAEEVLASGSVPEKVACWPRRSSRRSSCARSAPRAREDAAAAQGLHPEGDHRRAQGLPADRRIRDGRLGEIFLDMHKEGAGFRAMMNNFAIAVSVGLQYGVPLEEFVDAFTFTRFEPRAWCRATRRSSPRPRSSTTSSASSAISYLDRTDLAMSRQRASFDELGQGRGRAQRHHGLDGTATRSIDLLKQISSTGYLRNACRPTFWAPRWGWRAPQLRPATSATALATGTISARDKARIQGYEGDPCGRVRATTRWSATAPA